ncbi:MAG: PPC domain-containing protein [Pirellulales bacterium]
MRICALLAGTLVVYSIAAGVASAQPPAIALLSPGAVRPGAVTDVTISGANLAAPTTLWTSFPAKVELAPGVEKNGELADRVVYRIEVPADAPVGVAAVRIATGNGASSLRPMLVDDLPSAAESGDNHEPAKAQAIAAPTAVDGTCDALQSDFFRLPLKSGQAISFEVVAQRIGSALDAMVRLTDAAGKEVAFSDDEPGLGADGRFRFQCPADGEYVLEVRDARHQGGGGHYYRLRVGDFPLVSVPYPLGVQVGTTAAISAAGPAVEGVAPAILSVAANEPTSPRSIGFRFAGGGASGFATLLVGDKSEAVEAEPNDAAEQATRVTLPVAINGRFDKPRDRDVYEFAAKKGQKWTIAGAARSLGSPADLLLRVNKADGGGLGEAEDSGQSEGQLTVTIPEDGLYRLSVEDLLRRGGPQHAYRVEIEPYQPGFTLAVETDKLDFPQEGTVVAKVTCGRRDYAGPIELAVEGLGDGVVLSGQTIEKDKPETQLKITLPAGVTAGQLLNARIVGRAKIGESEFTATASTVAGLQKIMAGAPYPAPSLDGLLAAGVGPVYPPFFEISVDGGRVEFPEIVATTTFKVKLKRIDGNFKAPINVAVENLPTGVTAEVKPVGKGEAEYDVTLKGPEKLPDGVPPLRIVGTGEHNNQTKRAVLAEVPLAVVKPLAVSVAAAGPIAPGGQQKIKITATRMGDEKLAIALVWRKRPVGIDAPAELAIAPDASEVEVMLTAAADAPEGSFADLIVAATTKVKGQDVTVESPAATLEVKK